MRKYITIIALFLGIVTFVACDKDETQLSEQNANNYENVDKEKVNDSYDKANCNINCPVGDCEASGSVAHCSCVLGIFAKCKSGGTAMAPTQDSGQQNEAGNLSSFILNNIEPTTVANSLSTTVNNIQTAIETENTIEYENGLIDFENQMNDLSTSNKEAMNNYAESIDIEPIFNL